MINLASTSDKLRLTTSGAATVEVHASWVDLNGTTVTPGRTNTADISTATTTDIVAVASRFDHSQRQAAVDHQLPRFCDDRCDRAAH